MTENTGSSPTIVVVGGVNMDIGGQPLAPLVARDSNPGRVGMSLGGVGRNIAHNLRLLGMEVTMLTVLGGDSNAALIAGSCQALGIDLSSALRLESERTSTYLYITECGGEMAVAVSDMEIYRHLTPAFLQERLAILQSAALVVADANIPAESLAFLAENCTAPLFADPVSTTKAARLAPILGALHTLKPNLLEAELLSGVPITDAKSLEKAANALLDTGLQRVYISLSQDGVYAASREEHCRLPCLPAHMLSTTGCGDAFMAALCYSHLAGLTLAQSATMGLAAATVAMESLETINPALTAAEVRTRAGLA